MLRQMCRLNVPLRIFKWVFLQNYLIIILCPAEKRTTDVITYVNVNMVPSSVELNMAILYCVSIFLYNFFKHIKTKQLLM